jgi:hypothetical protein
LKPPRRELTRVDTATDTSGLPMSLIDEIEAHGGLWWAGDYYTDPQDIIAQAQKVAAIALRLDVRDLTLLESLPAVRYLHVRSDGRPILDPIASLRQLRALIIHTGALRGDLDPLAFPDLRWLRVGLGGKGGAAILPSMARGHPGVGWLTVSEVKARSVADIVAGFPALASLDVWYADHLRALGPLAEAVPRLRRLALTLTQVRSLDGIERLTELESLALAGGRVTDLAPLRGLPNLRYARLLLPAVPSIEPLRGHPALRLLELGIAGEPDQAVLESMHGLVAVGRGRRFEQPVRWPDLSALERDDPIKVEWSRAMRG